MDNLTKSSDTNVVDKVAMSATKAVDATKTAATSVLEGVANKVESVRSTLSPALDNAFAPLDAVMTFTRQNPLAALVAAVTTGAVLHALLRTRH
jgi:hypothetical protein